MELQEDKVVQDLFEPGTLLVDPKSLSLKQLVRPGDLIHQGIRPLANSPILVDKATIFAITG